MFIKLSFQDCENIIQLFKDIAEEENLTESEKRTLDKVRLIRAAQKIKQERSKETGVSNG